VKRTEGDFLILFAPRTGDLANFHFVSDPVVVDNRNGIKTTMKQRCIPQRVSNDNPNQVM